MKIVFAHNVYNRFLTLRDTVNIERKLFPNTKISIAYNDTLINLFYDYKDIQLIGFNEKPHKIGCVNGCILSIQQLLDVDFDVLIFSHDDVSMVETHIDIIKKHIDSIIGGEFDLICRKPLLYQNGIEIFGGYYMMEVFYISKNAAIKLFGDLKTLKDENEIPHCGGSIAPEAWFYQLVNNKELKINEIRFEVGEKYNNIFMNQQMGFYHKNADLRGWKD